jgi:hypothetical protein
MDQHGRTLCAAAAAGRFGAELAACSADTAALSGHVGADDDAWPARRPTRHARTPHALAQMRKQYVCVAA